jgi:hypothetical protein
MARRTVNLPDSVEALARDAAKSDESFSATVSPLIEQGVLCRGPQKPPRYAAAGGGPEDLGRAAERYLAEPVEAS